MARQTPLSHLKSSPQIELPTLERLKDVDPAHLLRKIKSSHNGLRKIQVEALGLQDPTTNESVGVFQSFTLDTKSNAPILSPSVLATLVKYIGEEYSRMRKVKITFRVFLLGVSDAGRDWQQQIRFTVDPTMLEDEQTEEEEEDEEDEDEDDDEDGDGDDEEDEDEEEDEEEEEDDMIDSDVVEREPAIRPTVVPAAAAPRPTPIHQQAMQRRELPPTMTRHPAVDVANEMGLPVQAGAMQFNPDFVVALVENSQVNTMRMVHGMLRESRRTMSSFRKNCASIMREHRRQMRETNRDAIEQRKLANDRSEKLENQLIEITRLNAQHYENFQLIAQHGWTAFRNAMDTESEYNGRIREYERAMLGQQLMFAQDQNRVTTVSAAGGWMKSILPMGLAVTATVMRKRGDTDLADLFATLAKNMSQVSDDEEEIDDEDEGDVIDATETAREAQPEPETKDPRAHTNGHTNGKALTPAIDAARDLRKSLSDAQASQLRKATINGFDALEEAANASVEASAIASLAKLDGFIRADAAVQNKVMKILDAVQQLKVMELVRLVQQNAPRRAPPRPAAEATA